MAIESAMVQWLERLPLGPWISFDLLMKALSHLKGFFYESLQEVFLSFY